MKKKSESEKLLNNLANAVLRYDKMTDRFICLLEKELTRKGVDYESIRGYDRIHMMRDERFCQVREILRIVKNDPHLLYC